MRRKISLGVAVILAALPGTLLFAPSPAIGANSLQSILSPAGLSAYDTATAGSYFAVSQTDFDNAASALSSVTKVGMTDTQRTDACATNWSPNYLVVIDNTIKTRAVFEINKGTNKNPAIDVNANIAPEDRRIACRAQAPHARIFTA